MGGLIVVLFLRIHPGTVKDGAHAAGVDGAGEAGDSGPAGAAIITGDPDASRPPKWVPSYPALQSESGGIRQEARDTISGTYLARTKDTPAKVKDYFDSTLQADGFETEATTSNTDGNEAITIDATNAGRKRKITVMASSERGTTSLMIRYQGPK